MVTEGSSQVFEALRRGTRRAGMHVLRAGLEMLSAAQAMLEELAEVAGPDREPPTRIPVEGEEESTRL
ncbi:MAG: hypothetical protein M3N51_02840 [Actinomycetota bacterium]|nr:hypothetical protein [Actinomycetota bacterium]